MAGKTRRNLHVPVPEALHERLRAAATRFGRPTTTLAREAIESWVEEREREEAAAEKVHAESLENLSRAIGRAEEEMARARREAGARPARIQGLLLRGAPRLLRGSSSLGITASASGARPEGARS